MCCSLLLCLFLDFTIQDSNMLGTDDREGNVEREGKRENTWEVKIHTPVLKRMYVHKTLTHKYNISGIELHAQELKSYYPAVKRVW